MCSSLNLTSTLTQELIDHNIKKIAERMHRIGVTSCDRNEIKMKYNLSDAEADAICEWLKEYEKPLKRYHVQVRKCENAQWEDEERLMNIEAKSKEIAVDYVKYYFRYQMGYVKGTVPDVAATWSYRVREESVSGENEWTYYCK